MTIHRYRHEYEAQTMSTTSKGNTEMRWLRNLSDGQGEEIRALHSEIAEMRAELRGKSQTMTAFAPADIAEVPLENMLRAMIDNAASAIVVHVDGVEYEVRMKATTRVNRAYAPKPQHGCPCAICIHS